MAPRRFDAAADGGATEADGDTTDADATRAERLLASVQNAAVERALVDDDGAARHLALAGGLERARRAAASDDGEGEDADRPSGLVASALLAVSTLAAFDAGEGRVGVDPASNGAVPARPTTPASPGLASSWPPADGDEADPSAAVVEGAAIAVRRFDADVRRAAALADVSVAALGRRIDSAPERRSR